MREILFRGKPVHKEDYTLNENMQYSVGYFKEGFVYGSLIVKHNKYYICVGVAGVLLNSLVNNATATLIEVIPETVGQYTGLTDKNGKRIFENDIVKIKGKTRYVFYGSSGFRHTNYGEYADTFEKVFTTVDCEVIGNIHDNHELNCWREA